MSRRTVRTFDAAAEDFNASRHRPWPSIEDMGSVKGKRILDLGAGAGRNYRHFSEKGAGLVVAADLSMGMLRTLMAEGADNPICVRCDARRLPFIDSVFDGVSFIATLHHIPDDAGRHEAAKEVIRVLTPGGVALITVWAPESKPRGVMPAMAGGGADIRVPWARIGERYYHIFTPDELRTLVQAAGLSVVKMYKERVSKREVGVNLVLVARK